MKKITLVPGYEISPVIKGGWQLSSGHSITSTISDDQAVADTVAFIEAGISTLDFGDIYTGVEDLIGRAIIELVDRHGPDARSMAQLHTKYVPNAKSLHDFDRSDVQNIVDRSLLRLGVEKVDLVQFHWWDYQANNYLIAMEELFKLKDAGKINHIGVTNFDLPRLQEFVRAGFKPASIQIQYSILDRRAEKGMVDFCIAEGIGILCYGTVAGGFLSEKYLGESAPSAFETRSNIKYQLVIEDFGGWQLFQELLTVLDQVAKNHNIDIATVASAYMLREPGVTSVIVGARNISHLSSNLEIPKIEFTNSELESIKLILDKSTPLSGDVFELERDSDRHRNIMHTNNN
jgi:aryl-alcohol dehydrogenase-like predicted oxidoreductase